MAFVTEYLNDKSNNRIVEKIFDETLNQYKERSPLLKEIAPIKTYTSFDFLALLSTRQLPAARIVAPNQEIPLSQAGSFRELRTEMAKIVVKQEWTELVQRELMKAINQSILTGVPVRNIYDSNSGGIKHIGTNGDLANQLFASHQDMAKSIYDRIDAMTWEALVKGEIVTEATDPSTGVKIKIDFKDPNAKYNHFPSALVASGNTGDPTLNMWTDLENANAIQNLVNALFTYRDTNGCSPDHIVMSLPTYTNLLNQQSTKDAVNQVRGSLSVGTVAPQMLSDILKARFLPDITVVDDRYVGYEEVLVNGRLEEKKVDNKRFVPDGYYLFAKKGMGERALGPTMENASQALANGNSIAQSKPGLSYKTWEEKHSPPIDSTQVTANALPVFIQDKLFFAQKVF